MLGIGDINNDGYADIILTTGVIFGKASGWAATVDFSTLASPAGFKFTGLVSPQTVAVADINGDGIKDLIISDLLADYSGKVYVIYGRAGDATAWPASPFDITTLADGIHGFSIAGIDGTWTDFGLVVAVGDLNGDGKPDLVMGAPAVTHNGHSNAGTIYVLYGKGTNWGNSATFDLSTIP